MLSLFYLNKSYAQEGEDLILARLFENKSTGFYVDVGAHHPYRFSNTFLFYKKGWSGINIDSCNAAINKFKLLRPRDTSIKAVVSDRKRKVVFNSFNESALNHIDFYGDGERLKYLENKGYKLKKKEEIETVSLNEILDNCFEGKNVNIDFLTIDVEGSEMNVLRGLDWGRYCPNIVLIEILRDKHGDNISSVDILEFMEDKGYIVVARSFNTVFFRKRNMEDGCNDK